MANYKSLVGVSGNWGIPITSLRFLVLTEVGPREGVGLGRGRWLLLCILQLSYSLGGFLMLLGFLLATVFK